MLFELISDTNKPKVQRRSGGGKRRFKGTGVIYVEEEKWRGGKVLKNVSFTDEGP